MPWNNFSAPGISGRHLSFCALELTEDLPRAHATLEPLPERSAAPAKIRAAAVVAAAAPAAQKSPPPPGISQLLRLGHPEGNLLR
ncbi:hypothetical protein CPAR01_03876 [Colletotrichum paranaense]|uniref:Uncharacterized protein n=1 Tax=Colletotrichum paranaense TaxID=1914294 RepID=A0ABQ9SUP1_9PEZI|nr:uncharacterized protein CPAR01_03876 [Colletotrichum paranaense]KAK1543243.1 hypothetical protein CPAR01_03876 [Colletotrichum paranaense]